jgi:hypothetical protein
MTYITSWIVTQKIYDYTFTNNDDFWYAYREPELTQHNEMCKAIGKLIETKTCLQPDFKSVIYSKKWTSKLDYDEYCATMLTKRKNQGSLLEFTPLAQHEHNDDVEAWVEY